MTLWEKCVDFHGHHCGGLRIGYAAAEYAMKLLNIGFSDNEQVVCICENDACGVDAIQVMLGCSIGKGNLLFHMTGKQAFSFYNRATGESVRLVLKPKPLNMTPEESKGYYFDRTCEELFDTMEAQIPPSPPRPKSSTATTANAAAKRLAPTGSGWQATRSSAWIAMKAIIGLMYDKIPCLRRGFSACQRTYDLAPLMYEGGWPKAGGSQNICCANILKFPLF